MKMTTTLAGRKWKTFLPAFILFLLLASGAWSQTLKITGKIASTTGDPVPNATISVKGTNNIVVSDANGNFSIDAGKGSTLVISSTGFNSREVKIAGISSLNIRLETQFRDLDDVVVVGYGKMKKTDLSSSQLTVTAKDIGRTVNSTVEQALQGRASNVYVTANSGQPGAAMSVVIRGVSSLNHSTQPLYVIDGVQIRPGNPGGGAGTSSNILAALNPDDIETINILQGPSATAIYGATGANGVVMITTKRGKSGETKISLNAGITIQEAPPIVPVMNLREYAAYRNTVAAAGVANFEPAFADPSALGEGTQWQKEMFRSTLLQKYGVSLSGGSDKTTFYLGLERFNQEGVISGSGFNRYSVRLNLENQTRNWLKIGTNLNVAQTKEVVNISNGDLLNIAISQNPSVPVKNPDGSWGGPTTTQYQFSNPVALSKINDNRNKSMIFNGGAYATLSLFKGLTVHTEFNTYYQSSNSYRFTPSYQFNGYGNSTTNSFRSSGINTWIGFHQRVQYDKQFGRHVITGMLGHESSEGNSESLSGGRQRFVSNNIQELSGGDATTATNNSGKSSNARESYFGRINYVYNDRYIFYASGRYDGSSNFGPENRWGFFPSFSAAWRISKEKFLENSSSSMNY